MQNLQCIHKISVQPGSTFSESNSEDINKENSNDIDVQIKSYQTNTQIPSFVYLLIACQGPENPCQR